MDNATASGTTTRDFQAFFDGIAGTELVVFEQRRRGALRAVLTWGALILVCGGALVLALFLAGAGGWAALPLIGVVGGLVWVHRHFTHEYFIDFKHRLIGALMRAYDERLFYEPDAGIGRHEFEAAGMFRELDVTDYASEDLVSGKLGPTDVRFCEVDAKNVRRVADSQGRQRREETRILKGVFFIADFNKHFAGTTYVRPDTAQRLFGALGQALQGMNSTYGQLVKLEDPEFERLFAVYSSDQIEARYILSSALMQRITAFRRRTGHNVHLAFVRSNLYVAIELNRALFEARLFRTLKDPAVFREFWDDLELVGAIVEDLNLNTRIWTKT